jgi:hypothetical protein
MKQSNYSVVVKNLGFGAPLSGNGKNELRFMNARKDKCASEVPLSDRHAFAFLGGELTVGQEANGSRRQVGQIMIYE